MTCDFWCLLLLSTSESLNQVPEPFGALQNAFFNRDIEKMLCKCKSPAAPVTPYFTKPQLGGSAAKKISFKWAVKNRSKPCNYCVPLNSAGISLLSILPLLRSSGSTAGSCPAGAAGYCAINAIFHEPTPARLCLQKSFCRFPQSQ